MKRMHAAALAAVGMSCAPLAASAQQGTVPERFGYCFAIDVPLRALWTTPVYELDIPFGRLLEQMQQDKAQFRDRIAQGARLSADTDANCVYKTSRAEAEAEVERTRKSFRFSRVDWTQVAWTPSPLRIQAPPPAAAPNPAPAPVAAVSKTRPADTGDIETDYWNRIADSQVVEDFDDYLKAFPKGRHAPLAQLEAKRLRRGGGASSTSSPPVPVAAPPSASAPVFTAVAALDPAVAQTLGGDPFFRLPAGKGATATWSGRRVISTRVGERVIETPLVQRSTLRRDGDLCMIDSHVESGSGDVFITDSVGATWAGFLPLEIAGHSVNKYAISDSSSRAISLRHGVQSLFPLQAGTTVELGLSTSNHYPGVPDSTFEMAWTCRVGGTVSAASLLPGTTGEATELVCDMRMPGIPGSSTYTQFYQWFGDVGCFVQDPNRP